MKGLVLLVVFTQTVCLCLADGGDGKFQFDNEEFVGLSSIRVRAKSLPVENKCAAYLNKLREANSGAGDASLIASAIDAIEQGKGQWKNSQFLLDDLIECQNLAGSVDVVGKGEQHDEMPREDAKAPVAVMKELEEYKLAATSYKDQLAQVRKELEDAKAYSSDLVAKQAKINATQESRIGQLEEEHAAKLVELETLKRKLDDCEPASAGHLEELAQLKKELEGERIRAAILDNDVNAKQAKIIALKQKYKTEPAETERKMNELRAELDSAREKARSELEEVKSKHEATIRKQSDALNSAANRERKLRNYMGESFYNDALGISSGWSMW